MIADNWIGLYFIISITGLMWLSWGETKPKKENKILSKTRRKRWFEKPIYDTENQGKHNYLQMDWIHLETYPHKGLD